MCRGFRLPAGTPIMRVYIIPAVVTFLSFVSFSLANFDPGPSADACDPVHDADVVSKARLADAFTHPLSTDERRRRLLSFATLVSRLPDGEFCSTAQDVLRQVAITTDDREASAMLAAGAAFILHRAHSIPCPCAGSLTHNDDARLHLLSSRLLASGGDPFEHASPDSLLKPIANFFGDTWALSLGVDGFVYSDALAFMHALLSRLPVEDVQAQRHQLAIAALFARMMERGGEVADSALFLAEFAKVLLVTSRDIVVPIGWVSTHEGHAMLMQIAYDDAATLTISVYNAGAGSDNTHAHVKHKDRINVVPVVKFVHVPLGDMLHDLDIVFQLFSMMTGPRAHIPTGQEQYSADDIYQRILFPLHQYHDASVLMPSTRFQQSGTCTMKSQLAYMQVSLGDRFRSVKEGLQRAALDLVTSVLDDTQLTIHQPHTWLFVLREVGRNVARRHLKHIDDHGRVAGGRVLNDDKFERVFRRVKQMVEGASMRVTIRKTTSIASSNDSHATISSFLDGPGVERIVRDSSDDYLSPEATLPSAFTTPLESTVSLRSLATAMEAHVVLNVPLVSTILSIPGHVLRPEHYSAMSKADADDVLTSITTIADGYVRRAFNHVSHWDSVLALNKLLIMMWRVMCRLDALVTDRGSVPLLSSLPMSNHNLCLLRHHKFLLSYDRSLVDHLDDMFDALGHPLDSCNTSTLLEENSMRNMMTEPMALRQWLQHVATRITTHENNLIRIPEDPTVSGFSNDVACIVYGELASGRLRYALPDTRSNGSLSTLSSFAASRVPVLIHWWTIIVVLLTTAERPVWRTVAGGPGVGNLPDDPQCPAEIVFPNPTFLSSAIPLKHRFATIGHFYSGPVYKSRTQHASNRFLRPRSLLWGPAESGTGLEVEWPALHESIRLVARASISQNRFLVSRHASAHRLTLTTMFRDQTRIPSILFAWQSGRLDVRNHTHQDMIDFALFQGPINTNGSLQDLCRRGSPLVDALLATARRAVDIIAPTTARDQRAILWLYALTFRVRSFLPRSDDECRIRRDLRLELENRVVQDRAVWSSLTIRSLAHAIIIFASSVDDDCPSGRDPDWLKHLLSWQGKRLTIYDFTDDDVDSGIAPDYGHIHHQADLFMADKLPRIVDDLNMLADGPALWTVLQQVRERRRAEFGAPCGNNYDEKDLVALASSLRWTCVNGAPFPVCAGSGQQGQCSFGLMWAEVRCRARDGSVLGVFAHQAAQMYGHRFLVSTLAIGRDPRVSIAKEYNNPPTFSVTPASTSFWTRLVLQMRNGKYLFEDGDPSAVVMHTKGAQYELVQHDARDSTRGTTFVWKQISDTSNVVLVTNDHLHPIERYSRASSSLSPVLYEFADPSTKTDFLARYGRAFVRVNNDVLDLQDGITAFDVFESETPSDCCHRVVFYKHIYMGAPLAFSSCSTPGSNDLVWEADPTFILDPDQRLHGIGKHTFIVVRQRGSNRVRAFAHALGFTRLVDVSRRQSDRMGVKVDVIVARERSDRILVAFCHLRDRRYALALSMLHSVHQLTPWTDDEFKLLDHMVNQHTDTVPEAIAVRTLVMFLDDDNLDLPGASKKVRPTRLMNANLLTTYYRVHGNLPIRFRLLAYNDLAGGRHDEWSRDNVILVRTRDQERRLLRRLFLNGPPDKGGSEFTEFQLAARMAWLANDHQPMYAEARVSSATWTFASSKVPVRKLDESRPETSWRQLYSVLHANPLAQGGDVFSDLGGLLDHADDNTVTLVRRRLFNWLFVATRGRLGSTISNSTSVQYFLQRMLYGTPRKGMPRWTLTPVTKLANDFPSDVCYSCFLDLDGMAQYPLPETLPDTVRPVQTAEDLFREFSQFELDLHRAMNANLRVLNTSQADATADAAEAMSMLQLTGVPEFERSRSNAVVLEAQRGAGRLREQSVRYELTAPATNIIVAVNGIASRLDALIEASDAAIRNIVRNGVPDRRHELFSQGLGADDQFEYQSLLHLLATSSPTLYKSRFPTLRDNDAVISQLHGALLRHVLLVVTRQHCLRIRRLVGAGDIQGAGAELAKTRMDPRAFKDIVSHPMIVVFELEANLRLRSDQCDDIVALLARRDSLSFQSMILQRLMAAGKTFVLGTLMALAKADGFHLSIMVPPAALFEQNSADMMVRSSAFFGQRARVITFSRRAEDFNEERLEALYETLVICIRNHQYVLMAPRTLHLLQNTYVDLVARQQASSSDPGTRASLHWLGQILRLLKERGAATFDEIDMTFDPKVEYNLATGDDIGADRLRVHFAASLFLHLSTSKLVDFSAREHSVDAKAYATTIQPRLVEWAADHISTSAHWASALKAGTSESSSMPDRDTLLRFLRSSGAEALEALPIGLSAIAKEHLAYVRVQLHLKVPFALQGNVNQHYGRSNLAGDPLPRPYVAANTPSETSEIASLWEIINRGAIMYLHSGLDREQAKAYVRWRKEKANLWEDPDFGEEGMQFKSLTSGALQLSTIDLDRDADRVREALRSPRPEVQAMLMDFVVEHILSKANVVQQQITGNVQDLGAMFHSLQGYSGTLENRFIFPDAIYSAPNAILLDAGANGQVLSRILHLGQDLLHVPDGPDPLAARILQAPSASPSTTALIDIGAHFKGIRNVDVAQDILQHLPNVRAVIFYDEASNQPRVLVGHSGGVDNRPLPGTDAATIQSVTGHSPIDSTAVFTYYDHRHITGSDVPQRIDASGVATISADTPLRDVLQGVMRMRKFLTTQKVQFVAFAGVPDVPAVLRHAQLVQFRQERKQNLQSVFQKVDAVVRDALLTKMYRTSVDSGEFEAMAKATSDGDAAVSSLFRRSQVETFLDQVVHEDALVTMRQLLDERRDALLNSDGVAAIFSDDERDALRDAIGSIVEGFPLLDELCPDNEPFDAGREQVQEQEQEQEQVQQKEQEVRVHDPEPEEAPLFTYRDEFLGQVQGVDGHAPLRRLNEIVRRIVRERAESMGTPAPDGVDRMIDDRIFVTNRFLQTRSRSTNGDDLVNKYRKTPFQVIVRISRRSPDLSVILASVEELNLVRELESSSALSTESMLVYTTTPSMVPSLREVPDDLSDVVRRLLVDVNLYHGALSVMNSDEWARARTDALDGTADAFRFYLRAVLYTNDFILESHRPEYVLSRWCPDHRGDNVSPSIEIPGAPYADPMAWRHRRQVPSRPRQGFQYGPNAGHSAFDLASVLGAGGDAAAEAMTGAAEAGAT